jgi:hypothetical protein
VDPSTRELLAELFERSREIRAQARGTQERSRTLRAKSGVIAHKIAERRLACALPNGQTPELPETLTRGIHTAATMPADTEPLYGRR